MSICRTGFRSTLSKPIEENSASKSSLLIGWSPISWKFVVNLERGRFIPSKLEIKSWISSINSSTKMSSKRPSSANSIRRWSISLLNGLRPWRSPILRFLWNIQWRWWIIETRFLREKFTFIFSLAKISHKKTICLCHTKPSSNKTPQAKCS